MESSTRVVDGKSAPQRQHKTELQSVAGWQRNETKDVKIPTSVQIRARICKIVNYKLSGKGISYPQ